MRTLAGLLLLCSAFAPAASATTYHWRPDYFGHTFDSATNWSPEGVPGEGDVIVCDGDTPALVFFPGGGFLPPYLQLPAGTLLAGMEMRADCPASAQWIAAGHLYNDGDVLVASGTLTASDEHDMTAFDVTVEGNGSFVGPHAPSVLGLRTGLFTPGCCTLDQTTFIVSNLWDGGTVDFGNHAVHTIGTWRSGAQPSTATKRYERISQVNGSLLFAFPETDGGCVDIVFQSPTGVLNVDRMIQTRPTARTAPTCATTRSASPSRSTRPAATGASACTASTSTSPWTSRRSTRTSS